MRPDQTESDRPRLLKTGPQTGFDRIKPDSTGPDELKADQAGPDWPRPAESGPQSGFDRLKPDQVGSNRF